MLKKDFITVIVPYHKKKFFFQETINSIIKQSYKNYELVVVYDDEDKSDLEHIKKILKSNKKKKIKLIINSKNLG